jgi:hypothetical protein
MQFHFTLLRPKARVFSAKFTLSITGSLRHPLLALKARIEQFVPFLPVRKYPSRSSYP